jgi:hypothetical protein
LLLLVLTLYFGLKKWCNKKYNKQAKGTAKTPRIRMFFFISEFTSIYLPMVFGLTRFQLPIGNGKFQLRRVQHHKKHYAQNKRIVYNTSVPMWKIFGYNSVTAHET